MKLDPDLPVDIQTVLDAAALLDVPEFQVFELAFLAWYGRKSGPQLEAAFTAYMYRDRVPMWVRAFTREIVRKAGDGRLDPAEYGIVHEPPTPTMIYLGIRYAVWTSLTLAVLVIGSHYMSGPTGCYFPPCY